MLNPFQWMSTSLPNLNVANYFLPFFAVLADCLNALAVGAPLLPGLRIFSPEPSAMRLRLALMLA